MVTPATPQFPPACLGKDKESWDVLLEEERTAAEKLGWTPESFDHGDPPVCSTAWETLEAEQRAAATVLGYEQVIWDAEYEVDQPPTPGKDKQYWSLLTLAEKHAATALGYDRCSWDEGWHVAKTTTPWAALNQWNRTDAADLGYTQELWDAEIEAEFEGATAAVETTRDVPALDSGLSSSSGGGTSSADFDYGASSGTRHGPNAPLPILDVRRRPDSNPLHTHTPCPLNQLSCGAAVAAAARAGRPPLRPARSPRAEQGRGRLALLPQPPARRHHRVLAAPEARRLRRCQQAPVDEQAARPPGHRAPPPAARHRRHLARRL